VAAVTSGGEFDTVLAADIVAWLLKSAGDTAVAIGVICHGPKDNSPTSALPAGFL
jgi:hypothetical protein